MTGRRAARTGTGGASLSGGREAEAGPERSQGTGREVTEIETGRSQDLVLERDTRRVTKDPVPRTSTGQDPRTDITTRTDETGKGTTLRS